MPRIFFCLKGWISLLDADSNSHSFLTYWFNSFLTKLFVSCSWFWFRISSFCGYNSTEFVEDYYIRHDFPPVFEDKVNVIFQSKGIFPQPFLSKNTCIYIIKRMTVSSFLVQDLSSSISWDVWLNSQHAFVFFSFFLTFRQNSYMTFMNWISYSVFPLVSRRLGSLVKSMAALQPCSIIPEPLTSLKLFTLHFIFDSSSVSVTGSAFALKVPILQVRSFSNKL